MNEHQQRLWQNMIDLIQHYLNGQTEDFDDLVGMLEGALDASEIKDHVMVSEWYDFWTPLEIRRAIDDGNVDKTKAIEELTAMRTFLLNSRGESE